jgi:hypothetical protein
LIDFLRSVMVFHLMESQCGLYGGLPRP